MLMMQRCASESYVMLEMHHIMYSTLRQKFYLQGDARDEQQRRADEQEGDWQAGAPADFQPFETSNPRNTSGHHINVVLKPGASQVSLIGWLRTAQCRNDGCNAPCVSCSAGLAFLCVSHTTCFLASHEGMSM